MSPFIRKIAALLLALGFVCHPAVLQARDISPSKWHNLSLSTTLTGICNTLSSVKLLTQLVKNNQCDPAAAVKLAEQYEGSAALTYKLLQALVDSGELTPREANAVTSLMDITRSIGEASEHLKIFLTAAKAEEGAACEQSLDVATQSVHTLLESRHVAKAD